MIRLVVAIPRGYMEPTMGEWPTTATSLRKSSRSVLKIQMWLHHVAPVKEICPKTSLNPFTLCSDRNGLENCDAMRRMCLSSLILRECALDCG